MTIKVGINGFGRIGRNVLRSALQHFSDIEVVAVNDLLAPDYLAYMLKFDSVHGRFKGDVSIDGSFLIVNGKKIRLSQEQDPANLKWSEVGADVIIESTGLFLDKAAGEKHLAADVVSQARKCGLFLQDRTGLSDAQLTKNLAISAFDERVRVGRRARSGPGPDARAKAQGR